MILIIGKVNLLLINLLKRHDNSLKIVNNWESGNFENNQAVNNEYVIQREQENNNHGYWIYTALILVYSLQGLIWFRSNLCKENKNNSWCVERCVEDWTESRINTSRGKFEVLLHRYCICAMKEVSHIVQLFVQIPCEPSFSLLFKLPG